MLESQDFCHETVETVTGGGWGWNPFTQQGCLVEKLKRLIYAYQTNHSTLNELSGFLFSTKIMFLWYISSVIINRIVYIYDK